ncbi:MAG: hypothetical protein IPJ37_04020 [Bacteroidales bacterium]|nr:hypothetical protein [Bacteroidales bacterium]
MDSKFNIRQLKGHLSMINAWIRSKHINPRVLFIITGIASTVWFLSRVIPKPSRAYYPCVRAAAPVMSGFIIYLLSVGGISIALRKTFRSLHSARLLSTSVWLIITAIMLGISLTSDLSVSTASVLPATGPEDGPNMPFGKGNGIKPGLVIWSWNPAATNENCKNIIDNGDWYFNPINADQKVISEMVSASVKKLGGKSDLKKSWN